MKEARKRKILYFSIVLLIMAFVQPSCKKSDIDFYDVQDLLGNWTLWNAVAANYSKDIAPMWNVRLNSDKTYFIETLSNQNLPSFDCRNNRFRLLLHCPMSNTHLVTRYLWEGEISGGRDPGFPI